MEAIPTEELPSREPQSIESAADLSHQAWKKTMQDMVDSTTRDGCYFGRFYDDDSAYILSSPVSAENGDGFVLISVNGPQMMFDHTGKGILGEAIIERIREHETGSVDPVNLKDYIVKLAESRTIELPNPNEDWRWFSYESISDPGIVKKAFLESRKAAAERKKISDQDKVGRWIDSTRMAEELQGLISTPSPSDT